MQLALTDHLRCTELHAETWLVARADVAEHGWMVEGVLGCPVCRVERAVHGGVVTWSAAGAPSAPGAVAAPNPGPDATIRLAALLALTDSHMPFVVCGAAGQHAAGLGGMATVALALIDPPDDSAAGLATVIRGAPHLPFAAGSVRGVALGAAHSGAEMIASAVGALAPGGRLVAPVGVQVPAGIRELARDSTEWVGERIADAAVSAPVPLTRARR